jgi:hypothetical protein
MSEKNDIEASSFFNFNGLDLYSLNNYLIGKGYTDELRTNLLSELEKMYNDIFIRITNSVAFPDKSRIALLNEIKDKTNDIVNKVIK